MIYSALLGLGLAFGDFEFFRINETFPKTILAMQMAGLSLLAWANSELSTIGQFIYIFSAITTLVYFARDRELDAKQRATAISLVLLIIAIHSAGILQLPNQGFIRFLSLVPVTLLIILFIIDHIQFRKERASLGITYGKAPDKKQLQQIREAVLRERKKDIQRDLLVFLISISLLTVV